MATDDYFAACIKIEVRLYLRNRWGCVTSSGLHRRQTASLNIREPYVRVCNSYAAQGCHAPRGTSLRLMCYSQRLATNTSCILIYKRDASMILARLASKIKMRFYIRE